MQLINNLKFELKTITDILSAPKNIGHNKWFISFFNDLKVADDYLHIIQIRSQHKWVDIYWNSVFERHIKEPNFYITSPQELLIMDYNKFIKINNLPLINKDNSITLNQNDNFFLADYLKSNDLIEQTKTHNFFSNIQTSFNSFSPDLNLKTLKILNSFKTSMVSFSMPLTSCRIDKLFFLQFNRK